MRVHKARVMRGASVATIAGLLASLTLAGGCDAELCAHPRHIRCEGDVLVSCPGGWGNLDITVNRDDCRKQGRRCVQIDLNGMREPWCMRPLGTCDPASYQPVCVDDSGSLQPNGWGDLRECIGGQVFASGPQCQLPEPPVSQPASSSEPSAPN